MAFNARDFFEMGSKIGEKNKSTTAYATENVMDKFKKREESDYEMEKLQGMEVFKRNLPPTNLEQSQIKLNESRSTGLRPGRKTAILNTRTGKAYEPGTKRELTEEEINSGEWIMRNQQFPPQGGLEKMTSAEASIKQLDDLKDLLIRKKSDQAFKFVGENTPVFGDSDTQRYNVIRKDFSDRLLRLRSGAQINEKEYGRLMGMLPQFWRSSDVDIEQLEKFKNEYVSLINRINTGGIELGEKTQYTNQSQGVQSGGSQQPDLVSAKSRLDEKLRKRGWA